MSDFEEQVNANEIESSGILDPTPEPVVAAPAPPAEPVSAPAPAEPAPAAEPPPQVNPLEEQAQALYGMSAESVLQGYGEARNKMLETTDEFGRYKQKMSGFESMQQQVATNPEYGSYMNEANQSFHEGQNNPASNALDPMARKMADMENRMNMQQLNSDIDRLNTENPGVMDAAGMKELAFRAQMDGSYDATTHFWKMNGANMVANATKAAHAKGIEAATKNVDQHIQSSTVTPAAVPTAAPANDFSDDAILNGIEQEYFR